MTVRMHSDYSRFGGHNTLEWNESDMVSLTRDFNDWKLTFTSATYTTNTIPVSEVSMNYVPRSTVEDKETYRSTSELIEQLEAWATHNETVRDEYKAQNSHVHLRLAAEYAIKAGLLRQIAKVLTDGEDIWETD